MPNVLFNGAIDTVSGAPSPALSGTSLTVTNSGRWPDPATVGPYPITVWPTATFYYNDSGIGERCMVTAKSGSTLTIVRGIEGTSTRSIIVGDQLAIAWGQQDLFGLASTPQRNWLHNSGFRLFQRQAPGTKADRADDTYGPDRWNILTQTASVDCDRTTGNKSPYAVRLTQKQAAAQRFGIEEMLEEYESRHFRSQAVRFSFYAKCSTTTTLRYAILEWTGTADSITSDVVNSWTSGTYTAGNFFLAANLTVTAVGSLSVGTSYTLCALRGSISSSCNNIIVFVWTESTAAQNVTVEVTDAQFGLDSFTQDWTPKPQAEELRNCQRYYEKSYDIDTAPGSVAGGGRIDQTGSAAQASEDILVTVTYQASKRSAATPTLYDNAGNSGKITEVASGLAVTNNITPSGTSSYGQRGWQLAHNPAGNITGVIFHWTSDAEL